jgi:hypothetical protein
MLHSGLRHEVIGMEVKLRAFLTSALDGGSWSASHFGRFTLGKGAPTVHSIEGLVGPAGRRGEETIPAPNP